MPSLGHDLATIRQNRGISLTQIQKSTKIPSHILTAIEDDSIFADMGSDSAYIRSYVRTYAKVLEIKDRKIIYALDRMEKKAYSGSLIDDDKRLDKSSSQVDDEGEASEDKDKKDQQSAEESEHKGPSPTKSSKKQLQGADRADSSVLHSKEIHSIDWANLGSKFQSSQSPQGKTKIGIIIAIVLLATAIFLAYWFFFKSGSTGVSSGSDLPSQTTNSNQPAAMPPASGDSTISSTSNFSSDGLADTLTVVVYAAYDKLEPIRVYTDIFDELNPYWIDQGEAIAFNFVNSFQFRGEVENVILLMNGHRIPNLREQFYNSETERIEINRSFFEESSRWNEPTPDTLNIDVPPPSVIHQLESQN